jgi:MATE family multidrug resistance protein
MTNSTAFALARRVAPRSSPTIDEGAKLLGLALPMTATALVNMGMSITDVAMMGRIGPEAVAAGAIVSDLYSIVYYLGAGALAAVAPELAQAIGAGRGRLVRRVTQQGLWMAAVLAVFALALLWHSSAFLGWAGIDPAIVGLSEGYARMMAVTAVPMMGLAVWRCVYAAAGSPRAILIATIAALPANAALDYVLMFGGFGIPALGLTGAGLASALVAAGMFAGLAAHTRFCEATRGYRILERFAPPDRRRLAALLRLGIPMGISGFTEVGVFLISTLLAGMFGPEALAAHAITLRMAGVIYALPLGLSQAATVRVGLAVGAGDPHAVARAVRAVLVLGLAAGSSIFLALASSRHAIPWLFLSADGAGAGEAARAAAFLLAVLSAIALAQGVGVVSSGALRGFKDARVPMAMSVFAFWGVGFSTIVLLAFAGGSGVEGIWLGIAAGAAANAALAALRLGWRMRRAVSG